MNHVDRPGSCVQPEALAEVPVFQSLSAGSLHRLSSGSRLLHLVDGDSVFLQGDAADGVFALLTGESGRVRIGALDTGGKRLLVEIFGPGGFFGELGVLTGASRNAAATVEGRVRLARLRAEDFLAVLAQEATLGAALSVLLAQRLQRTSTLFHDAAFETLEVRLARQLLDLARRSGGARPTADGGLRLTGRYRQGDLADLLGATTRSIITILNAWRTERIVAYDGDRALLTILDVARLQALTEDPHR